MDHQQDYPENEAVRVWKEGDAVFSIVKRSLDVFDNPLSILFSFPNDEYYCGYVRFPQRFMIEQGYRGILTYAPVHGGITYAEQDDDGSMVYGFDCNHDGDESNPQLTDMDWLKQECSHMADAIIIARDYEQRYLMAATNEEKAVVIGEYTQACAEKGIEQEEHNLGTHINLLGGRL